jgi:hypothetical protein
MHEITIAEITNLKSGYLRKRAGGRVIAASDRRSLLTERLALRADGRASGYYA